MQKKYAIPIVVLTLFTRIAAAEVSFLRQGDTILTVGDSITSQGAYQAQMQQVIDALYPDGRVRIINAGTGGMTAAGGAGVIEHHLKEKPTLITVMFGVNDTAWNPAGAKEKSQRFVEHMQKIIDVANKNKIPLVILRESGFSHHADVEPWVGQMNELLAQLQRAGDKLAADQNIPVIDVDGAYRDALCEAWKKNSHYEFTPDVIHPTHPGHAAIAAEILRAMGVGLPLATADRGPLHVKRTAPVTLKGVDAQGIVDPSGNLRVDVRCQNRSGKQVRGRLISVVAGIVQEKEVILDANGADLVALEFPVTKIDLTPVKSSTVRERIQPGQSPERIIRCHENATMWTRSFRCYVGPMWS